VSRLHVGLRLTGAGLDFPLSPDPCARPALCPIPKHQNSINVLTTSIICPIIACEYLPDHRFTNAPPQQHPSSDLLRLRNFLYPLSLQSVCALLNALAALFRTPVLCFQCFAHSFHKTPGGVGLPLPQSTQSKDQNDTKITQFRLHSRAMPASHSHRSPMPLCGRRPR